MKNDGKGEDAKWWEASSEPECVVCKTKKDSKGVLCGTCYQDLKTRNFTSWTRYPDNCEDAVRNESVDACCDSRCGICLPVSFKLDL